MVYIYKKKIGKNVYYYLRASIRKNNKTITKDILYLGENINEIKNKLKEVPIKYEPLIRKSYKKIQKFLESNHYYNQIIESKIKLDKDISKDVFYNIEACKLHYTKIFLKLDYRTINEIYKNFAVDFTYNTTSIEGNTITLKEAKDLLFNNLTPKNKTLREIYDLENTLEVFLDVINNLNQSISHELIINIHDKLMKNIDSRTGYRTEEVRVFKSNFDSSPGIYVKTDMELLLKWYNSNINKLHPLVLASVFHHKFEKIHPFMDGNGRTGRMLLNLILLKFNYPPLIISKKCRSNYLSALRISDKCALTKYETKYYLDLINFTSEQLIDNYWDIFL